ncbi:hypothetical protein B5F40_10805 [Gordonibacter sp. An230]|uniref:TetR/AcrR family transcriptional regulator n=1 Tax=Gordonibacter sp. An230 TaxID=1965592 RepID=UPI000B390F54|nr:TetR/AcrR family transcriptional regulator [Gordonibacter sp. An230]OUO89477.1 hypothetical protein B5F40_10805 [Gordonibacter sp. An230]
MYREPKDSRQRYTKQCLFQSFIDELESKPVSDITVKDICEAAGVSRKTFYKYYSDPFALLRAMEDDLMYGLEMRLRELPANVFDISPMIIGFIDEHRTLVRTTFENRGEGNFIDRMIAYLFDAYHEEWERANPSLSHEDVEFLFHYVTSGWIGIVRHWLNDRPDMTPSEVAAKADTLMRLSTPQP